MMRVSAWLERRVRAALDEPVVIVSTESIPQPPPDPIPAPETLEERATRIGTTPENLKHWKPLPDEPLAWPQTCPHYYEYHRAICCRVGSVCGPQVRLETNRKNLVDCCADPGQIGAWRSVLAEVSRAGQCGDAFGTANEVIVAFGARAAIRDYLHAAGWSMRVMFFDYRWEHCATLDTEEIPPSWADEWGRSP